MHKVSQLTPGQDADTIKSGTKEGDLWWEVSKDIAALGLPTLKSLLSPV